MIKKDVNELGGKGPMTDQDVKVKVWK